MDFVKKAAEGIKGNSGQKQVDPNAQAQGAGQQDYVDKGKLSHVFTV